MKRDTQSLNACAPHVVASCSTTKDTKFAIQLDIGKDVGGFNQNRCNCKREEKAQQIVGGITKDQGHLHSMEGKGDIM